MLFLSFFCVSLKLHAIEKTIIVELKKLELNFYSYLDFWWCLFALFYRYYQLLKDFHQLYQYMFIGLKYFLLFSLVLNIFLDFGQLVVEVNTWVSWDVFDLPESQ